MVLRSVQQDRAIQAVVRSVMDSGPKQHLVLEAVAGAGKTFTLLEIVAEVRRAMPKARILLLAFNVETGSLRTERRRRSERPDGTTVA